MFKRLSILTSSVTALLSVVSIAFCSEISNQIRSLSENAEARIVWLRGGCRVNGGGALMGFDSETSREIELLPASYRQNRPIICSDGNGVVVTIDYQVHYVDWNKPGQKQYLAQGICSDVWVNPVDGREWIVVRTGGKSEDGKIIRYLLDDPSQQFLLWDKTPAGYSYHSWWQISEDGKLAADLLPWGQNGCLVINGGLVSNGETEILATGCWSSVASDNSHFWFVLQMPDGHRTIKVFQAYRALGEIELNPRPLPPGCVDNEFYHPRFASKGGKFMTCTGGYQGNTGSDDAEVYLGKFNSECTGFDGWVRITDNNTADYVPDAWIGVKPREASIEFSACSLSFMISKRNPQPLVQEMNVGSCCGPLRDLEARSDAAWLSCQASAGSGIYAISNTINPDGLAPGVHRATVTISASNAIPHVKRYEVIVTVLGETAPCTIELAPAQPRIVKGQTLALHAIVRDQYGRAIIPQPPIQWSTTGNEISVSDGVLHSGDVEGTFGVEARAGGAVANMSAVICAFSKCTVKVDCGESVQPAKGWEGDAGYIIEEEYNWLRDLRKVSEPVYPAENSPDGIYASVRTGIRSYVLGHIPDGSYKVRMHLAGEYGGADVPAYTIEGIAMPDTTSLQPVACLSGFAGVREFAVTVTGGDGMLIESRGGSRIGMADAGIEIIADERPQTIALLTPKEGDKLTVGETVVIEWESTDEISGVDIRISVDNGISWHSILDGSSIDKYNPSYGAYQWVIPAEISDAQGEPVSLAAQSIILRICDYANESVDDMSALLAIDDQVTRIRKNKSSLVPRLALAGGDKALRFSVAQYGHYSASLYNMHGAKVAFDSWTGAGEHTPAWKYGAGTYIVMLDCDGKRVLKQKYIAQR